MSVIPTKSSLNFVGKSTWEALSHRPVRDELWIDVHLVPHISMARAADAIIIAPATADLIARLTQGRAEDLLTNVVLAAKAPIILVPAMHSEMWLNAATLANVATLRSRGVIVLEPDVGRLTGEDIGPGRYPEISRILESLDLALNHKADLIGCKILISAGGTREPIDPVRYIGNNSSGKQGAAIAEVACARGADVVLVMANLPNTVIEGVEIIHVSTAMEMLSALESKFQKCDVLIMTAAVADAKPSTKSSKKIEKRFFTHIELEENPDLLMILSKMKVNQIMIGFAAQTGDGGFAAAKSKLINKNLDFVYYNDVSGGAIFGADDTTGDIIEASGNVIHVDPVSKIILAQELLDLVADKLG